eukprot:763466-Hanusia_phi.AAC.6
MFGSNKSKQGQSRVKAGSKQGQSGGKGSEWSNLRSNERGLHGKRDIKKLSDGYVGNAERLARC